MRAWTYSTALAALLAVAVAAPATAQQPPAAAPPGKQQVRLAKGSPLAKVFFAEPALVLDDDGTYSGAMGRIGQELGWTCGATESFGWEFREKTQEERQKHASAIFDATMQAFTKSGYKLVERKVRAVPDPESPVFTAERKDNKLVMLWSPLKDATILLVCDANATKGKPPAQKKP